MKTVRLLSLIVAWIFPILCGSGEMLGQYLEYVDLGSSVSARAQALAVDSKGNVFIASNVVEASGASQIRVTKTDSNGNTIATLDFGSTEGDALAALAVDPQDNLVLVGSTSSTDFPIVSPIVAKTSRTAGFIVRINSQLNQILLSSRIGGTTATGGGEGYTLASAVAIDSSGNVCITGNTSNTDFPVTPGAFQTKPLYIPDPTGYAFIMQVTPTGKIGYATYFGGSSVTCNGGSSCLFVFGYTAVNSIAVDPTGAVVIAGNTTATDLPITPGTFGQKCLCTNLVPVGFIAKFSPTGTQLVFSTYLVDTPPNFGIVSITSVIFDGSGNVIVGGTAPFGFGVTPGTVGQLFPF